MSSSSSLRKSLRPSKPTEIFQSPFKTGPKKRSESTPNRKSRRITTQFSPFQSPSISKKIRKVVWKPTSNRKSQRLTTQFSPFQSPSISKKIRRVISNQVIVFDPQTEADTPKAGKVTKIISKQVVEWEPTPFDPEEYFLQDEAEAERMRDYKFSMVILFKLIFLSSFLLAF